MKTADLLGRYRVHCHSRLYSTTQQTFKSDKKITQSVKGTGGTLKSNVATYSIVLANQ